MSPKFVFKQMMKLEMSSSAPGNQCQLQKMMLWILTLTQYLKAKRRHSTLRKCEYWKNIVVHLDGGVWREGFEFQFLFWMNWIKYNWEKFSLVKNYRWIKALLICGFEMIRCKRLYQTHIITSVFVCAKFSKLKSITCS